jgi:AraC-like DNA-binding protein
MKSTPAVVRGGILTYYKRLALSLNIDPNALVKRAGIERRYLDNPELSLPIGRLVNLLEITATSSGIEDFGLRLGASRGLPDLGPITLMLREEPTVGDALRTLLSLLHLYSDAIYIKLEDGDQPFLTFNLITDRNTDCKQAIETIMANFTSTLRWLLGDEWSPALITFTHSPPVVQIRHDRFFRCQVDFLQEWNGIVLRSRDLARKLLASSPVMRQHVERYIRSIDVAPSQTYSYRVTQVVAMALPRGDARATRVARFLGVDRRTLNRRLKRDGLNFSTVVDNVRRNLATQHLLGSDRPLSDIAGVLGFASLSAFTRWFRESFGDPPSAWRRKQKRQRRC